MKICIYSGFRVWGFRAGLGWIVFGEEIVLKVLATEAYLGVLICPCLSSLPNLAASVGLFEMQVGINTREAMPRKGLGQTYALGKA